MASKRRNIYTWLLAALVISTVCLACQAQGTATSDATKPAEGLSEAKQAVNTAASTEPGPGYRAEDEDIPSSTKSVEQKQVDAKATQSVTTKSDADEEKEHTGAYHLMGERADGDPGSGTKSKKSKQKKSSDSSDEYFSNEKYQYGGLQWNMLPVCS